MKLYLTEEGESLHDVAQRCHVDVEVLQKVNKHIKNPAYIPVDTQITIPSVMGIEGIQLDQPPQQQEAFNHNKGNVCAYVEDEVVHYNQLNITHWPSQDYTHPHPKNGTHAAERFGQNAMPKPKPIQTRNQNASYNTPQLMNSNSHFQRNWERPSSYFQKD